MNHEIIRCERIQTNGSFEQCFGEGNPGVTYQCDGGEAGIHIWARGAELKPTMSLDFQKGERFLIVGDIVHLPKR